MLILAGAGTGKTTPWRIAPHIMVLKRRGSGAHPHADFLRAARPGNDSAHSGHRRGSPVGPRQRRGDRSVVSQIAVVWGPFHSMGNRILRLYAKHLGLEPQLHGCCDRADAGGTCMDVVRHELGVLRQGQALSPQGCLSGDLFVFGVNTRLSTETNHSKNNFLGVVNGSRISRACIANMSVANKKNRRPGFRRPAALLACDDAKNPQLAQVCRRISITCWSTSTRTPAPCRARIVPRAQTRRPGGYGGRRRCAGHLLVPRRRGREYFGICRSLQAQSPKFVVLAQNYRSTQQVLDSANALMAELAPASIARPCLERGNPRRTRSTWPWMMRKPKPKYITGKMLQTREIGGSLKRHAVLVSQLASQRRARSRAHQGATSRS